MKRIILLLTLVALSVLALAACAPAAQPAEQVPVEEEPLAEPLEAPETPTENQEENQEVELVQEASWTDETLTDINGESFQISDFAGQHVYVESFAVWCPNCKKQQQTVTEFHDVDSEAITIAVNTDANEDENLVRDYVSENGFTSRYVVASSEFTNTLIAEFGTGIVSAPSVPMIHICPDGNAVLMDRGQKSIEDLQQVQTRC